MIVDPVEALLRTTTTKATSSLLIPTTSASRSPTSIPTLIPDVIESVASSGKTTFWLVFGIMLLSTIAFTYMAFRVPVQKRLLYVLTALITTFATISYFATATGDGNSYAHIIVKTVNKDSPGTLGSVYRQIFWARYIDWALTTPLILLDLSFLAGLNGANILVAVVADLIMILLGLFATFGNGDLQKWGYYTFACIAYLVIVYQLAIPGRRAVISKNSSTVKLFTAIGGFTLIIWTLYPIVWAFGDGSRKLSVNSEVVAYAVLDILAKPVFGFWLLFAHAKNAASIEGFWSHGLGSEGSIRIDDDEA